ncbi:MAG: TIGR03790 family protein [Chthoniobacterales bacterium]|nr:TIGR03790 family protein [Chthoniobacterales bacterium]
MRSRPLRCRTFWAVLVMTVACSCARAEEPLAPATIVVFNSAIPESADLAKFYAEKRGIPRKNLIGLDCSRDEEITREDYDRTIRDPLRKVFQQRNWWTVKESADAPPTVTANTVRFVALIRGMPLKVTATENYPGDKPAGGPVASRNDASVDSEIAVLARFSPEISGAVTNPYFQSYRAIGETNKFGLMLVCRLDASSAATVRRMITDAIEAEKTGLWGRAYVDGAHNTSGGLQIGDTWLAEIPQQLRKVGVPVVYDDQPAIFPDGFPISDCALYYGWYAGTAAGPFADPSFSFVPGAVAVHIHSFSASTLRDPNANWAAPLLSKGAAATVGNVYEPYLQLTAHLNLLNDRLLHGFTFAESVYMATPAVSWMGVAIGDPLYRPYASWLQLDSKRELPKRSAPWRMYHEFAVANASRQPADYREAARQVALRAKNGPMIEDLGLIAAAEGSHASAATHFGQARALYSARDDILRVVMEEAESWLKQGQRKRAAEVVRSVLRIVSDGPSAALLRKLEEQAPPPAPAASPVSPRRR